jgi:hypothetical protein
MNRFVGLTDISCETCNIEFSVSGRCNKSTHLAYLKERIQRGIIELHSVRQGVKCNSEAKFVRCSLCVTKKYMELERVYFIKLFSVLLRKVGHTQTWHKAINYKNYMVFTFGVFHIHENLIRIFHIT